MQERQGPGGALVGAGGPRARGVPMGSGFPWGGLGFQGRLTGPWEGVGPGGGSVGVRGFQGRLTALGQEM